jgi:hypothetical protein
MSHDLRDKKFVDNKHLHNTGHGDVAFDHEKELTPLRSRSLKADIENGISENRDSCEVDSDKESDEERELQQGLLNKLQKQGKSREREQIKIKKENKRKRSADEVSEGEELKELEKGQARVQQLQKEQKSREEKETSRKQRRG